MNKIYQNALEEVVDEIWELYDTDQSGYLNFDETK